MNTDQPFRVMRERVLEQDAWMMHNLPPYDTEGGLFSPSAKHWRRENGIGPWPEDYADSRLPGDAHTPECNAANDPDASAPLAPRGTACAGCGASQQTRYYDLHGKRTPFCSRCSVGLEHSPWTPRPARAARRYACAFLLSFLSLPAFAAPQPCRINVNTATPEQLQLLARTGPVLAGRLASGRPYRHLLAVDAVRGIGPVWLAANGPHVAFSGKTTCTEKVKAAPKVAVQAPKP